MIIAKIYVSCARDGATFELASESLRYQRSPRVFIAFDEQFKFEHISNDRFRAIFEVLTGLHGCEYAARFHDAFSENLIVEVTSP